jgi:hypothetical protein
LRALCFNELGKKGSGYGDIDNLTYGYTGNRLNTVTDGVSGNHEVDFRSFRVSCKGL